jgi:hypothetical protein
LWDIQSDRGIGCACYGYEFFNNAGTVQKSGGTGTSYLSLPFYNTGSLSLFSGSVDFNSANAYAQADATLNFGIAGAGGATPLVVSGNLSLDGTMTASFVNDYTPKPGDTIPLIACGALANSFSYLNLPTAGNNLAWRVAYAANAVSLQVVSNGNVTAQITGSVTDNNSAPVTNITVFAFTTNSNSSVFLSTATDANGHYVLNVTNGLWRVGVQGLVVRGYNDIPTQDVSVNNTSQVVNFVVQPYTGQSYTITVAANPPAGGAATGGGVFLPGGPVTLTATANTNTLPYFFADWTENGLLESASNPYVFQAERNRNLVANFTLPSFTISASNNPPAGGTVTGTGSYFYGSTSVLTADPNFGYNFGSWTENGTIIGTSPTLTTVVYSNHTFVANYTAGNTNHFVTTATQPPGLAVVTGAGIYTNGQSVTFSAPPVVVSGQYDYFFQKFVLTNNMVSTSASFTKTFSTVDPTNLEYVAVYASLGITPLVTNVTVNFPNPVPATTNFQIAFQFDRTMNTNFTPRVTLTNSAQGALQPVVPAGGHWASVVQNNDTFYPPPITFTNGMDGTIQVFVSGAQDPLGGTVSSTNVYAIDLDATPPVLSNIAATPSVLSAFVTWNSDKPASSLVEYGMSPAYGLSSGLYSQSVTAHGVTLYSLNPLTTYHYRVHSRDQAGNETISGDNSFTTFAAPDLQVTNLSVTGSLISGGNLLISWADTNSGLGATFSYWYDQVIVTNSATGQTLLNSSVFYDPSVNGSIASGGSQSRQLTFQLPNGPSGAGSLQVMVTVNAYGNQYEANGSGSAQMNNTESITLSSALAAYPDLQITGLAVTNSQIQSGKVVGIVWNDANTGNGAVSNSFDDQIVVVNQTTAQTLVSTVLADNAGAAPIASGQSVGRQFSFVLPDGAAGAGTLQIMITADIYNNVFEYNASGTAKSNNTNSIVAASTLAPYPDLVVTNVVVPASANAGQTIPVTWTDYNQGTGPATNTWYDEVFLSSVNALGGGQLLGTFAYSNGLAVSQSTNITQTVTLPQFVQGNQWIVVKANALASFFESSTTNNSSISSQPISIAPTLQLSFSPASISESAGTNAVTATVIRNGDLSSPLLVQLSTATGTNVYVPPNVTIPAGQSAMNFLVGPIDNFISGSPVAEEISAAAAGFPTTVMPLTVLDNDPTTLTLSLSSGSVNEDAGPKGLQGTVTRNANFGSALTVTLISDLPSALTVPASVTIPAGQAASAVFSLSPVPVSGISDTRVANVTASAPGFSPASAAVNVLNVNTVQLSLNLQYSTVNKGAGSSADIGTVSIPAALSSDQMIQLTVQNSSIVMTPGLLTIPAGTTSVNFNISVTNDYLATGTQTATLIAQPVTLRGMALTAGEASAMLSILDVNGPTLSLSLASSTISKSNSTIATISRNTPPTNAVTVTLASSPSGIVSIPTSVVLPLNQSSNTFTVSGIMDNQQTGTQQAAVNASATGFNPASAALSVSDIYLPDLVPTVIMAPTNGPTSGQVTLSWVVVNNGLAATTNQTWNDYVYLASSSVGQSQTFIAAVPNMSALPIGASYTNQATFFLPPTPGNYWFMVVVDGGNVVAELNKQNNTLVSSQPVVVNPAYRATITNVVPVIADEGTPVVLSGWAYNPLNNQPAPNSTVTVSVQVNETTRQYNVASDANGNFTYTFQPLATEAGDYTAGADYPSLSQVPSQVSFVLLGMQALPVSLSPQLLPNTPLNGQLVLNNLTDHPLTGLAVTVPDLQGNLSAQFTFTNTTLPGGGAVTVNYTLQSPLTSSAQIRFSAIVTSIEGAQVTLPVSASVVPLVPQLIANPGYLSSGMVVGQQTVLAFGVQNTGGASSGDLAVQLPANLTWMTLGSPATIPSIPAGGKATVTLILNPPANLPLTLYTGNLALFNGNVGVSEPFQIRAVSESTGDLRVTTTDDYTYYEAGAPKVTNATVTVRDPFTSSVIAQTNSDANGIADFPALPAGPYTIDATASQHNQFRGSASVVAGITNALEAFMPRQLVTYQWTVVPTTIPDQYQIVLQSVFQTQVPVPNVVVKEPQVMLLVAPGAVSQFIITLSNEGLIAANGVTISVPSDPNYLVTPLVTNVGIIPAQSSVQIPVTVQLQSTAAARAAAKAKGGGAVPHDEGCGACSTSSLNECLPDIPLGVNYYYVCGNNNVLQQRSVDLSVICTAKGVLDCLKSLKEVAGSENLVSLGCNALAGLLDCAAEQYGICLNPCQKGAIAALCGAAVGGVAGAASSSLNSLPECLCYALKNLPLPALPSGTSLVDGGIGLPGGGGGGNWIVTGFPVETGIDIGGSDCTYGSGHIAIPPGSKVITNACTPAGVGSTPRLSPMQNHDGTQGVCATVRLQIDQQVVMSRSAFTGSLELDDGGSTGLSGIQVNLSFRNATNGDASSKFVIEGPVLTSLTAVDGTGTLAGGATGSAAYTFVPTDDAAPTAPATYQIGGTLSYVDSGQTVTVPLLSAPITVYPEAKLDLLYFQQRDVYGPDAVNPQLSEPSQPFDLGLIVKNIGAGTAHDFQITSAQPQIVDNEKGLLINFTIIGTELGDQPLTPSLTANLGDIAPGVSKEVTWQLLSSLAGKFISFNATFQHLDDLGTTNTSLINSVEIHELTHQVLANRPTDDDVPDFLVNDIPDPNNLPDTVYLSDGTVAAVNVVTNGVFDAPAGAGHLNVQLTTTVINGWNYIELPDPGVGYLLERVVRSDGTMLPMTNDAWTTSVSFPSSSTGAVAQNLVHLFDWAGTGSYTLYYHSTNTTPPAITQLGPVTPFNQSGAVSSVNIEFSEPIDVTTFSYTNLTLTLNGGGNLITSGSGITLALVSGATYAITGLQTFTAADGNYQLSVSGEGIYDLWQNNTGDVSASTQWAKGNAAPVVQGIAPIVPTPRNVPVGSVTVTFSKSINPATFGAGSLSLSLNGGPNLINGGVTVSAQSTNVFTLNGLGPLTGGQGNYVLTVNAAGVQDMNGTPGFGSQSAAWSMITTGPTITALQPISTNPRNIVVQALTVTFSEPIDPATFDYNDVALTLNGGPNLVTSAVGVAQVSPATYLITNISWVQGYAGTYTLTVNAAGISDLAGNAGSGSTNESWTMILETPRAPADLKITPDLGISSTDGLTSTNNIVLSGTVGSSNLNVQVFDQTLGLSLGTATMAGTNFSIPLTFMIEGFHNLQANAVDAAGNASLASFFGLFLDVVPPTAIIQQVSNPIYSAVSNIPVTFSKGINTNTLSATNFVVTLNGTNMFTPTLTYVSSNAFLLGNLASFTAPPGDYQVSLYLNGIQDYAGNQSPNVVTMSWARGTQLPPVIAQATNLLVSSGGSVALRVQAFDPNGYQLRYSLALGAPAGAFIDATNGDFSWVPTCAQGSSTNPITVLVTDDANPPLSSSMTFLVAVSDCVQVGVGSTTVPAGQSACLPVNLLSTVGLTNLSFTLEFPTNRFSNWAITATNPAVGTASVQVLDAGHVQFQIATKAGQVLEGPTSVGTICFNVLPGASGFIQVQTAEVVGSKRDGSTVASASGESTRLVIVSLEPLLEASLSANRGRLLTLYGNPGTSYEVDYTTNLLGAKWQYGWRVPMTNFYEVFAASASLPQVFYRAFEFSANPPMLELNSSAPSNLVMLVYGQKGSNYAIISGTNLLNTTSWSPIVGFTLTNSFQFINAGVATNRMQFFRARQQ